MSDKPIIEFLHKDFSYVIFCIIYVIIMNFYLISKVGKARKQYGVKYPAVYSDTSNVFNCIQRAHQNYLEQLPLLLVELVVVGVAYPKFAAACGAIYVTSRYSYAQGYYTGDPDKRQKGVYGMIGYLGLILGLIVVGLRQCDCLSQYLNFF